MKRRAALMAIGLCPLLGAASWASTVSQSELSVDSGLLPQRLMFGVVPQQSAYKLARIWLPLLAEVSKRSGVEIIFATAPDIPTFEQRVREGVYDLAYMNPYHYTVYHQSNGYEALVRARDQSIRGIFVVRKDSPLQSLEDLNLADLAYPAPAAFAATILPQATLAGLGVESRPFYVLSHDAVYRGVAAGRFVAGGGIQRTFNSLEPEVRDQLRVLWTSPGYTPHPIAAHPRVTDEVRQRLLAVFSGLAQDEKGATLLTALKYSGFQVASDNEWDDVRALRINRLE
uniref:phosphate/phosphite/phosphonate ABC transporter substrate-binding protein n=1 Tax=Marinobacterium profundum TaxID=1714300 RepID=UPI000AE9D6B2|nr:phosphate/phosphite/phosphonate ABC transporter substrate-binding protein [Marinobacterium profundum]